METEKKKETGPIARIWELGRSGHSGIIASVILAVIGVISGVVPYLMTSFIVKGMISGERSLSYYLPYCVTALAAYMANAVLYNLSLDVSHNATFKILADIRERMVDKITRLPIGTISGMSSGKLKNIFYDRVDSMEAILAHLFPEMTANILGSAAVLVYIFIVDWRMGLLSLVSIVLGLIVAMGGMLSYDKDFKGSVEAGNKMTKKIIEYISGIKVIKAFNQGNASYGELEAAVNGNADYYYNWMKKCQFAMGFGYAIAPATAIAILPAGWHFWQSGSLTSAGFFMCIILSLGIVGPLLKVMSFTDNIATMTSTIDLVDEVLQGRDQEHSTERKVLPSLDISAENVGFGYTEEKRVINGASFQISEGSYAALVGPSGSGKSTLAKLIAGLWDADHGSIKIGGIDTKEIPLSQLYEMISFVSQDNFLFNESILENIRVGRKEASDEEVINAAKSAAADEFIRSLPDGYDTIVGSNGSKLSGGECQRITIARAILKNSPIVLLDEATAYIDPENEALIQQGIASLVKDKTLIVIAHRLSTITDADKIFVINEGRVEASGTHEELMNGSQLYRDMFETYMKGADQR
ncbi:MAG TPA: ABC transporter ATP-binding protein [Ruminococcus sp.]|nr:ABC transporter ATP-binding protein [Ruminococcus sp.]